MATETAIPFAGSAIATSQQYRDRYRWSIPDGIDAPVSLVSGSGSGAVSDGGAGGSVNVQNVSAIVQGARYDLTGGPLNLPVAANGGGSNRYDIVCLTYDAGHSPAVYCRIVQGTPGSGLPALTHNASGVWDFPLYHYQKTPAGAITGLTDRRRYLSVFTGEVLTPSATTPDVIWPVAAARQGARLRVHGASPQLWEFDGTSWALLKGLITTATAASFTSKTLIGTYPNAFQANVPLNTSIRCRAWGDVAHSGVVDIGLAFHLDNSAGAIVADATGLSWQTNIAGTRGWYAELEALITATGAAGTIKSILKTYDHVEATGPAQQTMEIVESRTIDTTAAHNLVLLATCSVSSASNVVRTLGGTFDKNTWW